MRQEQINWKPKSVRRMRPDDYERWVAEQDADRARRARNRARRAAREAAGFLADTEGRG